MKDFYGNYASEQETADTIKTLFEKTGYIIDIKEIIKYLIFIGSTD